MKAAIYTRVSTDKQELDQQIQSCLKYCEFKEFKDPVIYAEIGSGKNFNRAQFQELIKHLRLGIYEAIVAFRFDRLGRNSREVCLFFDEMEARGIKIYSVHENLDTSTPIGRAMREILVTLAQLERENISEATRHRLDALRKMGKTLGRAPKQLDLATAQSMRNTGASWAMVAKTLNCPASTIRSQLKALRKREAQKAPAVQVSNQPLVNDGVVHNTEAQISQENTPGIPVKIDEAAGGYAENGSPGSTDRDGS